MHRKAFRREKNSALNEDTCAEKERVWLKVTPRKVGAGLKQREELNERSEGSALAWDRQLCLASSGGRLAVDCSHKKFSEGGGKQKEE